jgi:hypothetical protein
MDGGMGAPKDGVSKDLKDAFPDMGRFSPRNLKYMRKLAEHWPDFSIVQRTVAQLPWRSNILLREGGRIRPALGSKKSAARPNSLSTIH